MADESSFQIIEEPHEEEADLELMYRRALEAIEAAEVEVGHAFEELNEPEPAPPPDSDDPPPSRSTADRAETDQLLDGQAGGPRAGQIVEAALFVGGEPLTAKRLTQLLGGGFSAEQIERMIDELNHRYSGQSRPYEVRLVEGGYRMQLRDEYEPVRERAFGLGPKEVKLSQEAIEVLAVVAYEQPVARERLEGLRKNAPALLRQLLRRELIQLDRDAESEVTYQTTPRFLQLFGLGALDELPRADDVDFK